MDDTTSVPVERKTCTGCGMEKPLTDYSFDKRHADGRQSRCKQCFNDYKRRLREAQPERLREQRAREYERNKAQYVASRSAYRAANRDRLQESARQRVEAMSPAEKELSRKSRRRSSAKYRAKNREACAERIAAWRRANPEKVIDAIHRRRARQRGNGKIEEFTRSEVGERDGWVCGICRAAIDPAATWPDLQSASLDHVVPLAKGGPHIRSNCRITHWICNVRRGDGD